MNFDEDFLDKDMLKSQLVAAKQQLLQKDELLTGAAKQIEEYQALLNNANNTQLVFSWYLTAYKNALKGMGYFCPVCGNLVDAYEPLSYHYIHAYQQYKVPNYEWEMLNKFSYACPKCTASDRERLIALYLALNLPENTIGKFLHIAPSPALQEYINKRYKNIKQTTADLFMPNVDMKLDITNMHQIADCSYNYFLCVHVLEHVNNDMAAMKELHRILSDTGFGICIVPVDLSSEHTDEEWGLPEEENWRRFGQDDHARKYAKADYVSRLKEAGFTVEQPGITTFGEDTYKKLGMNTTATLYVVKK